MEKVYNTQTHVALQKMGGPLNFAMADLHSAKLFLEQGLIIKAYQEIDRVIENLRDARDKKS